MVEKHFFFNGMTMNNIWKRAHVTMHSHGRCMVGEFDNILLEVYICAGPRSVLSFILKKLTIPHFVQNSTQFYDKYIKPSDRKNILMMMGVVSFQRRRI